VPDDAARQRTVRLRSETALKYQQLWDRHRAEEEELESEFLEQLHALGLRDEEVIEEYLRMVREATPGADVERYRVRELLRRHSAGEDLSSEDLATVKNVLESGDESIYLEWRSDAEKESGQ
jgi:hypothetical protein